MNADAANRSAILTQLFQMFGLCILPYGVRCCVLLNLKFPIAIEPLSKIFSNIIVLFVILLRINVSWNAIIINTVKFYLNKIIFN